MVASSSIKPRRDGSPGNQKARKPGFYSSQNLAFNQSGENPLSLNLQAEVAFIHQSMQRFFSLGKPTTYQIDRSARDPSLSIQSPPALCPRCCPFHLPASEKSPSPKPCVSNRTLTTGT